MRLGILAVIFVSACASNGAPAGVVTEGSADVSPRDSLTSRTLPEACADLADARCRELSLCGSFADRAVYKDIETCTRAVRETCIAEWSLPGMIGAVARTDACAHGIGALSCLSRRDLRAQEQACEKALVRGVFADGDLCVHDAQCAGGACERGPRGCGVCVRAPVAGDLCASPGGCGKLVCNTQFGRCETAPPVPLGSARAGDLCDEIACDPGDGLHCIGVEARRCALTAVVPLGGSCADEASGLPVLCAAPNARCDHVSWTCTPKIALGLPCETHGDCVDGAACVRSEGRYRCVSAADACR